MVPGSLSSSAAASVTEEQRRPSLAAARPASPPLPPPLAAAVPDPPHHTHTHALPAPACPRRRASGRQPGSCSFCQGGRWYGKLDLLLKVAFNLHAASD